MSWAEEHLLVFLVNVDLEFEKGGDERDDLVCQGRFAESLLNVQ